MSPRAISHQGDRPRIGFSVIHFSSKKVLASNSLQKNNLPISTSQPSEREACPGTWRPRFHRFQHRPCMARPCASIAFTTLLPEVPLPEGFAAGPSSSCRPSCLL